MVDRVYYAISEALCCNGGDAAYDVRLRPLFGLGIGHLTVNIRT
jgi:hypothetical protein